MTQAVNGQIRAHFFRPWSFFVVHLGEVFDHSIEGLRQASGLPRFSVGVVRDVNRARRGCFNQTREAGVFATIAKHLSFLGDPFESGFFALVRRTFDTCANGHRANRLFPKTSPTAKLDGASEPWLFPRYGQIDNGLNFTQTPAFANYLATPEGIELAVLFLSLKSQQIRRRVLQLLRTLSNEQTAILS